MAGSPLRRARREAGQVTADAAMIATFRGKVYEWMPRLADLMYELANGITVQEGQGDKVRVYQRPPDYRAISYLMDRVMGKPLTEVDPATARLNTARAVYLEEQVMLGLIAAQKRELEARAGKSEVELEMWPKQFVTEEEELSNLQAIAAAANKPLLSMTPEAFEEILKDKDPSAALEELKGYLGRAQADIIAEVMQYKEKGAAVTEEEEEEE